MPSLGRVRTIMRSKRITKILGKSPSMFKSRRSIMKGSIKTSAMRDELEKIALRPETVARSVVSGLRGRGVGGEISLKAGGLVREAYENVRRVRGVSPYEQIRAVPKAYKHLRRSLRLAKAAPTKPKTAAARGEHKIPEKNREKKAEALKVALGPIGMLATGLGLRGLASGIGRKLLGRAAKGAPGKILKRRAGQTLKMVKKPRARRAMRRGGTALEYGSMFAPSKAPAQPSQAQGVQIR